jgi:hypothetical protein
MLRRKEMQRGWEIKIKGEEVIQMRIRKNDYYDWWVIIIFLVFD